MSTGRRGHVLDSNSASSAAVSVPSVTNEASFHALIHVEDPLLVTDPLHAAGDGRVERTLHPDDSWIDFTHIDGDHDADHQSSIQSTQIEQLADHATPDISLGEVQDFMSFNENTGGGVDAGALNIDLDGEFLFFLTSSCR